MSTHAFEHRRHRHDRPRGQMREATTAEVLLDECKANEFQRCEGSQRTQGGHQETQPSQNSEKGKDGG